MNMQSASSIDNAPDIQRLRWRARRGMLENDLIMERFFAKHAVLLQSEAYAQAFAQLLTLPDTELFDLLMKKIELSACALADVQPTPPLLDLLERLRQA